MKYKLLSVSKSNKLKEVNIGDYIQALASSQYYPHVDGFLDRDTELKSYDGESCKMIMNGWYMHNPENWPPSEYISPLFVAFHINSLALDKMINKECICYLKRHEPIGCRDINTMNILKKYNINAYFSGCMTLTLGKKYKTDEIDGKTYIVDPLFDIDFNIKEIILSIFHFLIYAKDIIYLLRNKGLQIHNGKNKLIKIIKTILFHKEYSRIFSRKVVMESEYICQQSKYYKDNFSTEEERLHEAERLVKKYAKAKFVITSRIHCALPCLGLGTPVIYLEKQNDIEASKCRLNGLRDLFNIIKVDKNILLPDFPTNIPITTIPKNKDDWKKFAEQLDNRCTNFIHKL